MLRPQALRCWKCGLDLLHPERGPEGKEEILPAVVIEPEITGDPGPCPTAAIARWLDPRLSEEELDRSVRAHAILPLAESYYRIVATAGGWPYLRDATDDPASAATGLSAAELRGDLRVLLLGSVFWPLVLVVAALLLLGAPGTLRVLAALPLAALYAWAVVVSKAVRVSAARRRYLDALRPPVETAW